MAGEYLIDPPPGAGCPVLEDDPDGWRIVVEAFYNATVGSRVYGSDLYASGVYGDAGGTPPSSWVDLTERAYGTVVTRGTKNGTYRQPVDRITFEVVDDDGSLWDVDPGSIYALRAGVPVRVGLLDPDGAYTPLSTGRIERLEDVHDVPPRNVSLEAVGMLSDTVVNRIDIARPEETAGTRAAYYLNLAGWSWTPIPTPTSVPSTFVLAADPTPGPVEVRGELDRIARSVGLFQSTDRRGEWFADQWPIMPADVAPIELVDCADPDVSPFDPDAFTFPFGADRRLPTAVLRYVEDRAVLLNLVQFTKRGGTPADSITVQDDVSIAVNGTVSNTYGMPFIDCVYKTRADVVPVAARILERFGNVTKRLEAFDFDSLLDPRWVAYTAQLDLAVPVTVDRAHPDPLRSAAIVVGYVLRLDRGRVRGTVYLQTVED